MNAAGLLFSFVAILAGCLFPIQTTINARLAAGVGGPIPSTLISFLAGGAALALIATLTRHLPQWHDVKTLPAWLLVSGGMLGATYLCLNVFLVPRIGAGAMMALAIAGQMISALTIDTSGALGVAARELTVGRIFGAIFVVLGSAMVRFL